MIFLAEKKGNELAIIALVAIVAIVGLIVMFMNKGSSATYMPIATAEQASNLGGEAIASRYTIPDKEVVAIPKTKTTTPTIIAKPTSGTGSSGSGGSSGGGSGDNIMCATFGYNSLCGATCNKLEDIDEAFFWTGDTCCVNADEYVGSGQAVDILESEGDYCGMLNILTILGDG